MGAGDFKVRAELVAKDNMSGVFGKARDAVNAGSKGMKGSIQEVETQSKKTGISLGQLAKAAGGLYIFHKVTSFMKESVRMFSEQEQASARVEAAIRSTGGAAGVTSEELHKMASGLQGVTTFGDETILRGQSMLLTFTKIGKDVFPQATEAMLNLATSMGTDVKDAAIQLGKALNDPAVGVTALQRVGITMSAAQKDQIEQFVAVGDAAGAQRIILGELETQFGGLARAVAETGTGKLIQFQNQIGDLREELAGPLMGAMGNTINIFGAFETAADGTSQATLTAQKIGRGLAKVFAATAVTVKILWESLQILGGGIQTWIIEAGLKAEKTLNSLSISAQTVGRVFKAVVSGEFGSIGGILDEQGGKLVENNRIFAKASELAWEDFTKKTEGNIGDITNAWEGYNLALVEIDGNTKKVAKSAQDFKPPPALDVEGKKVTTKEIDFSKIELARQREIEELRIQVREDGLEKEIALERFRFRVLEEENSTRHEFLEAAEALHLKKIEDLQIAHNEKLLKSQAEFTQARLDAIANLGGGVASMVGGFREIEKANQAAKIAQMEQNGASKEQIEQAQKNANKQTTLAKLLQKVAIFETIASTYAGVAKALNSPLPPPIPQIDAASRLAQGLGALANIKAQKFAQGGIVGGNSFSGDQVSARLNSGEMVLNKKHQAQLFAMANGKGGGGDTYNFEAPQIHVGAGANRQEVMEAVDEGYARAINNLRRTSENARYRGVTV